MFTSAPFYPQYFSQAWTPHVPAYDNSLLAMLSVFQCMTLSGWVFVMYRVIDGTTYASVIYFILLVIFGNYFILNLFLAVLKIKFAKAQSLLQSRMKGNKRQGRFSRLVASVYTASEQYVMDKWTRDRINEHLSEIDFQAERRRQNGKVASVLRIYLLHITWNDYFAAVALCSLPTCQQSAPV